MNRFGNYIGNTFSNNDGCVICKEDTIILNEEDKTEWPDVTLAIFIEQATPFLREFFQKISNLNYPKTKLTVLIHNNEKYHNLEVEKFFITSQGVYASIKYLSSSDDLSEHEARRAAV